MGEQKIGKNTGYWLGFKFPEKDKRPNFLQKKDISLPKKGQQVQSFKYKCNKFPYEGQKSVFLY